MLARQNPTRHGEEIYHEGAKATKGLVSVIASEAKQSRENRVAGLLRRSAPRNDAPFRSALRIFVVNLERRVMPRSLAP
jgi:hypothetical protein